MLPAEAGMCMGNQHGKHQKLDRRFKEINQVALTIDRYSVAWMTKCREELVAEVVGHVSKEISRAIWFFREKGGKLREKFYDEKYRPSPIPKGGLEIVLFSIIEETDDF